MDDSYKVLNKMLEKCCCLEKLIDRLVVVKNIPDDVLLESTFSKELKKTCATSLFEMFESGELDRSLFNKLSLDMCLEVIAAHKLENLENSKKFGMINDAFIPRGVLAVKECDDADLLSRVAEQLDNPDDDTMWKFRIERPELYIAIQDRLCHHFGALSSILREGPTSIKLANIMRLKHQALEMLLTRDRHISPEDGSCLSVESDNCFVEILMQYFCEHADAPARLWDVIDLELITPSLLVHCISSPELAKAHESIGDAIHEKMTACVPTHLYYSKIDKQYTTLSFRVGDVVDNTQPQIWYLHGLHIQLLIFHKPVHVANYATYMTLLTPLKNVRAIKCNMRLTIVSVDGETVTSNMSMYICNGGRNLFSVGQHSWHVDDRAEIEIIAIDGIPTNSDS